MKKQKYVFIIIFIALNLVIGIGSVAGVELNIVMGGVEIEKSFPEMKLQMLYSGAWQNQYSDYLDQTNVARPLLVKNYNSIVYAVGGNNNGIVKGKHGWLFGEGYVQSYMAREIYNVYDDYAAEFAVIKEVLENEGKEVIYIISPSKAEIYSEYLPWTATLNETEQMDNTLHYSLCSTFDKCGVDYYDATNIMFRLKDEGYPAFYRGGVHWNEMAAFTALNAAMDNRIDYDYQVFSYPQDADNDLYALENVWINLKDGDYTRVTVNKTYDTIRQNIAFIGTSFCGQWMNAFANSEPVFNKIRYYRYMLTETVIDENGMTSSSIGDTAIESIVSGIADSDVIIFETNANGVSEPHLKMVDELYNYYVREGKIRNSVVEFTSEADGNEYIAGGIYDADEYGTWTTGDWKLQFEIDDIEQIKEVILDFEGFSYQNNYIVSVELNGTDVGDLKVFDDNSLGTLYVKKELLKEGYNNLYFTIRNIKSPSEVIGSEDFRKLGIYLKSIKISIL